ncbi:MAG TPA: diadenosine tetraphosphate hydrolase [Arthrobacter bacterium]|jgi:histidine triad (HIT) family protein|nr:diadenosine tetraphosphate hydrolase [Arthrobacter sp.]HAP91761.1 diadenosine tetraphosphate hydrolase [Arthrobacter sp.]HBH58097.1 diadenosine tetraphosphate hydrolase [Arthrobacter sp.]HCB59231.1 diadenosine tetraphosphate hydrolase [Arthrobacter sp.]HCC40037.1 diadenosine tetraphosphate hydrolase [Arthrobacter sp.]
MSTLFTKIINGEIPGRFVWREADVAAFLTTGPLADGHTLVVPTEEVDRWTDASPETLAKVMEVARRIGAVQLEVFPAERAGLIVAGYEISHLHVHVWPSTSMADFDFASADQNPDPAVLDANAEKLRAGLRAAGYTEFVPES